MNSILSSGHLTAGLSILIVFFYLVYAIVWRKGSEVLLMMLPFIISGLSLLVAICNKGFVRVAAIIVILLMILLVILGSMYAAALGKAWQN